MIVHRCEGSDELDEEEIAEKGVDECWYWYKEGDYDEGEGQLLMRKGKTYYLHDCGHCSCYGPLDELYLGKGFDSLEEVEKYCSEGLLEDVKQLIDMARKEDSQNGLA